MLIATVRAARQPLPVDDLLGDVRVALDRHGVVVLTAPPGSGKTTRVPPSLTDAGRVLLVQPRRVAARSVARRIAYEGGSTVGEAVGWQVRFERKFSSRTQLLVVTEGVLLARLQEDPFLTDVQTVVLDEIHERSAQMDLAVALLRQVRTAREDLRLVLMSATLDAAQLSEAFDSCPVLQASGRPHPVDVSYRDGVSPGDAIVDAHQTSEGHLLCFLPGMADIARTEEAIAGRVGGARVFRLHGSLSPEEQDAALEDSSPRKILLSTNVAETSLTVDGVTTVVDSGLHKVMRHDRRLGFDRLATERISNDSATQRTGRAGRTAPGRAVRLWNPAQKLREVREPQIHRIDLAPLLLELLAWAEDPRRFAWLERPHDEAIDSGLALLEALGATHAGSLTEAGRTMRRLPLPPRLARVLIETGGGRRAAEMCATLAEPFGRSHRGIGATTSSDVLAALADFRHAPRASRRAADQIETIARRVLDTPAHARIPSDDDLRRALLAGYGDRLARRRTPGSDRVILANGHGGRLATESGVREGEWLVAVAVRGATPGAGPESLVEVASRVEREWLPSPEERVEHVFDAEQGRVRAVRRRRIGSLVVDESPAKVDPEHALPLLRTAFENRTPDEAERRLRARALVAGVRLDLDRWTDAMLAGAVALPNPDFLAYLPHDERARLERLAPESLDAPSGRRHRLTYRDDGDVVLAVKLQELFGLTTSPTVGAPPRPVTLSLLAPSGRPVQTTRDLASFWSETYPQVRKELRGRYAKHPWPEDPLSATPTSRTKKRSS